MNVNKQLKFRREALIAMSALQRAQLHAQVHAVRESMSTAGICASLLNTLKQHKLLVAGAVMAMFVFKPGRIMAGLETGLVGWQVWRNIAPALQQFLKRPE